VDNLKGVPAAGKAVDYCIVGESADDLNANCGAARADENAEGYISICLLELASERPAGIRSGQGRANCDLPLACRGRH
jgi:hypothetical protein